MAQRARCKAQRNKRGPQRAKKSPLRLHCAFKGCRSRRDCKNISTSLQVRRAEINQSFCRPIRSHSVWVRFCCVSHLRKGTDGKTQKNRGPREVLDENQVVYLFKTLVRNNAPWAAIIMLFQVLLAERCDAIRQMKVNWLLNFEPGEGAPAAVEIPKVNGKTVARAVAVSRDFANLVYTWIYSKPLKSPEAQWPFSGQPLERHSTCLFPGLSGCGRGSKRTWNKAVTQRGYLEQIRKAATFLQKERAAHRRAGLQHPFDESSLKHLGTHSFKRTGVTLLKDQCRSTNVVSSISGTSRATLEKIYDTPTRKRQREASSAAFDGIVRNVHEDKKRKRKKKSLPEDLEFNFCPRCGKAKAKQDWIHCPFCGKTYDAH